MPVAAELNISSARGKVSTVKYCGMHTGRNPMVQPFVSSDITFQSKYRMKAGSIAGYWNGEEEDPGVQLLSKYNPFDRLHCEYCE